MKLAVIAIGGFGVGVVTSALSLGLGVTVGAAIVWAALIIAIWERS